jgi:hypothetical protein
MKNTMTVASAVLAATFLSIPVAAFPEQGGGGAPLAQALQLTPFPLERGIAASSREGVPISAKYETEDDDGDEIQLSVYTMKGGEPIFDPATGDVTMASPAFSEVIVDYKTGSIEKVVPITGGEDLADAKDQSRAMARTKRSLEAATAEAVKANSGFRAVSATPGLADGHPVAKVVLISGKEWRTVYEKLD